MTRRGVAIVGGLPIALLVAYGLTPPVARLDDPYIVLHSARALLSGSDPVFNVPALVGVTSPVYLALLTAILWPGMVMGDTALRAANALGIVAYLAAVWGLGTVFNLSMGRRLALLTLAFASGWVAINLTNGMETGWAMALLTFAIAGAYKGRLVPVCCATGLLPFLRPDLAPAAGLVLLYAVTGRPRRVQVGGIILAVLVAAPWLAWTRLDTGMWLPQTMYAKQVFYAEGCWPWTTKALSVARSAGLLLVQLAPLSLGLVMLPRDRLGRLGLLSIAISVAAYFVALPGALTHNFLRYPYAFVVPWLCFGVALGVQRVAAGLAVTAALAILAAQLATSGNTARGFSFDEMKSSAEWIEAHVPADAVLLVHDAGGISEFAHHRAVDLVGLKTPSSIALHARWTWATCGAARRTAVGAIARTSGASYFVARVGWGAPLHADLEAEGFLLTPMRSPADAMSGYTVYRLQSRGPDR